MCASQHWDMQGEGEQARPSITGLESTWAIIREVYVASTTSAREALKRQPDQDKERVLIISAGVVMLTVLAIIWCCLRTVCNRDRARAVKLQPNYKRLQIDTHEREDQQQEPAGKMSTERSTGSTRDQEGPAATGSKSVPPNLGRVIVVPKSAKECRAGETSIRRAGIHRDHLPRNCGGRSPPASARSASGSSRATSPAPDGRLHSARRTSPSATQSPRLSARSSKSSCVTFNRVSGIPGPGAYELETDSLSQRSARSHNTAATKGNAQFMTCETRHGVQVSSRGVPGPGYYHTEQLSARQQTKNEEGRAGIMQFISKSARGGDYSPAPLSNVQCYDYPHLYGCGEASASQQMTSSFLSALPMYGHVMRSATPPVSRYSPEKPQTKHLGLSSEGSSCFAGRTPQHPMQCAGLYTTGSGIGPATYFTGQESLEQRMKDSKRRQRVEVGFGSSERRGDPSTWC